MECRLRNCSKEKQTKLLWLFIGGGNITPYDWLRRNSVVKLETLDRWTERKQVVRVQSTSRASNLTRLTQARLAVAMAFAYRNIASLRHSSTAECRFELPRFKRKNENDGSFTPLKVSNLKRRWGSLSSFVLCFVEDFRIRKIIIISLPSFWTLIFMVTYTLEWIERGVSAEGAPMRGVGEKMFVWPTLSWSLAESAGNISVGAVTRQQDCSTCTASSPRPPLFRHSLLPKVYFQLGKITQRVYDWTISENRFLRASCLWLRICTPNHDYHFRSDQKYTMGSSIIRGKKKDFRMTINRNSWNVIAGQNSLA